jgi:predicted signal transduction protein with EAL and GGDEF domain
MFDIAPSIHLRSLALTLLASASLTLAGCASVPTAPEGLVQVPYVPMVSQEASVYALYMAGQTAINSGRSAEAARYFAEAQNLDSGNSMLAERHFPTSLLRIELTENALIDNSDKTIALLTELRRLGIKVIIDNFGTGYASLSYLKNLPVNGLKIDRTFIRGLPEDRGNAAIIQAITTLAGKLGLEAMAEGVETAAEMKALRSFDCENMQGTFISEPLPLSQLKDFLDTLPQLRQLHLLKNESAAG